MVSGGAFTQTSTGVLEIELAGAGLLDMDLFGSAGSLNLAGALDVSLLGGYVPDAGAVHPVISGSAVNGTFEQVNLPPLPPDRAWNVDYTATSVELAVAAGPFAYRVSQWDPGPGQFVELGYVDPYETMLSLEDYYSYGTPNASQANFPGGEAPEPVNDESQLFLTHSAVDGMALVFVNDRSELPLGGRRGRAGRVALRASRRSQRRGLVRRR